MKIRLSIIALWIMAGLYGQEGMPIYNTSLLGDEYILHPSMAGRSVCGDLSFSARQQWFGTDDHPATYVASYNSRLGTRRGVGAYLMHDNNGPTNQTQMQLTYNHHLVFNDDIRHPHRLQMALSGQALFFSYGDLSSLVENNLDPILANKSYTTFNANLSFTYLNGPLRASFTANDLFSYEVKNDDLNEPVNLKNYITTVEYKFKPSEMTSVSPIATYIIEEQGGRNMLDLGVKASVGFNRDSRLWGRLSYRSYTDDGFQGLALTPVVGLDKENWKLSYSYDFDLGDYGTYYHGGHQIRLGIKLLCQNVCRCDYDEW